jgi:DNA polymerase-3 subunit gamma/tau
VDMSKLADELALMLRHLFVARATGAAPEDLADADKDAIVALSREADAAQLARLFDIVHTSGWEVARAPQPRLAFEMALLKGLHLAPAGSLPDLVTRVERLMSGASAPAQAGAPGGRSGERTFRA